MLEEARRVYPFRELNSLNTVGYKELFKYLDGEWTLDFAIEKIKRNSRVYAPQTNDLVQTGHQHPMGFIRMMKRQ